MIKCPHCGAGIKASSLAGASFFRPIVCLQCAHASRVVRPFGQSSIVFLFGLLLGILSTNLFAFPYFLIALAGIFSIVWALDTLLLSRTAKLTPMLPKDSRHAA